MRIAIPESSYFFEKGATAPSASWLDGLVERLLQPRLALAATLAVLIAGGTAGLASAAATARAAAQERYVTAISPHVR